MIDTTDYDLRTHACRNGLHKEFEKGIRFKRAAYVVQAHALIDGAVADVLGLLRIVAERRGADRAEECSERRVNGLERVAHDLPVLVVEFVAAWRLEEALVAVVAPVGALADRLLPARKDRRRFGRLDPSLTTGISMHGTSYGSTSVAHLVKKHWRAAAERSVA